MGKKANKKKTVSRVLMPMKPKHQTNVLQKKNTSLSSVKNILKPQTTATKYKIKDLCHLLTGCGSTQLKLSACNSIRGQLARTFAHNLSEDLPPLLSTAMLVMTGPGEEERRATRGWLQILLAKGEQQLLLCSNGLGKQLTAALQDQHKQQLGMELLQWLLHTSPAVISPHASPILACVVSLVGSDSIVGEQAKMVAELFTSSCPTDEFCGTSSYQSLVSKLDSIKLQQRQNLQEKLLNQKQVLEQNDEQKQSEGKLETIEESTFLEASRSLLDNLSVMNSLLNMLVDPQDRQFSATKGPIDDDFSSPGVVHQAQSLQKFSAVCLCAHTNLLQELTKRCPTAADSAAVLQCWHKCCGSLMGLLRLMQNLDACSDDGVRVEQLLLLFNDELGEEITAALQNEHKQQLGMELLQWLLHTSPAIISPHASPILSCVVSLVGSDKIVGEQATKMVAEMFTSGYANNRPDYNTKLQELENLQQKPSDQKRQKPKQQQSQVKLEPVEEGSFLEASRSLLISLSCTNYLLKLLDLQELQFPATKGSIDDDFSSPGVVHQAQSLQKFSAVCLCAHTNLLQELAKRCPTAADSAAMLQCWHKCCGSLMGLLRLMQNLECSGDGVRSQDWVSRLVSPLLQQLPSAAAHCTTLQPDCDAVVAALNLHLHSHSLHYCCTAAHGVMERAEQLSGDGLQVWGQLLRDVLLRLSSPDAHYSDGSTDDALSSLSADCSNTLDTSQISSCSSDDVKDTSVQCPERMDITKMEIAKMDITKMDITKMDITKMDITKMDITKMNITKSSPIMNDLTKANELLLALLECYKRQPCHNEIRHICLEVLSNIKDNPLENCNAAAEQWFNELLQELGRGAPLPCSLLDTVLHLSTLHSSPSLHLTDPALAAAILDNIMNSPAWSPGMKQLLLDELLNY